MIRRLRVRFIRIASVSVLCVMIVLSLIVNTANLISTNSDLDETLELIYENQGTIPTDLIKKSEKPDSEPDSDGSVSDSVSDEKPEPKQNDVSGNEEPKKATDSSAEQPKEADTASGYGISSEASDTKETPPSKQKSTGQFNQETPYSTRYFVLRVRGNGDIESSNLDNIASVTEDEVSEYALVAAGNGPGTGYYGSYRFLINKQGNDRYMAIFLECSQEIRAVKKVALWSAIAVVVCSVLVYLLITILSRKAIEPAVKATAQQKQFITDATHELKTPLTVINTSLSVLEMEAGQSKWIDKARGQTVKMSALINELITLSRLDEDEPRINKSCYCLSDSITELADSFGDEALGEGFDFKAEITPGIQYNGDENAIRKLIGIILDNALKYASPGSMITLNLESRHRGIVIRQTNLCDSMSKETLERLFDRFYRPDESRNSETGGFGIGLSIARSIVEAHGGTIKAECTGEGIICFTVCL